MVTDDGVQWELRNDTVVNVAGLLKGPIGTSRSYRLSLDSVVADGELIARDVSGTVRLTRLRDGIMVSVKGEGLSPIVCVRCLREYDQPFEIAFDEEYFQIVDVRTGAALGNVDVLDDEEEVSRIDDNHELDLREPLRQEILVSLPMRPDCGSDCPGPDLLEVGADDDADEAVDARLAALANLLGDERTGN